MKELVSSQLICYLYENVLDCCLYDKSKLSSIPCSDAIQKNLMHLYSQAFKLIAKKPFVLTQTLFPRFSTYLQCMPLIMYNVTFFYFISFKMNGKKTCHLKGSKNDDFNNSVKELMETNLIVLNFIN